MNNNNPSFSPAALLSHHHAQTMLASMGPRRFFVQGRARAMLQASQQQILDCPDGVRLSGAYTPSQSGQSDSLVILLHGWEGCITSSYLLSAGARLYNRGHSLFRLNFRDHGDSHHLNRELFNSYRLKEVLDAVQIITEKYPHRQVCLAGFSLGGNFAIRIASQAAALNLPLKQVAAVCPLISPRHTTDDIEGGLWIYHYYFMRRWKQSLAKKLHLFDDYDYGDVLAASTRLSQLNQYFVPNHTPFSQPDEYLDAYSIVQDTLDAIQVPMHLLVAGDDPIVQTRLFKRLSLPADFNVQITSQGGHCGFIKDWTFNSFADDWLEHHFKW